MCFAPGSPSLRSFVFPATFPNTIYTLPSSKRKIPAPSHFQVILCILIRSSREKFDNTLELGPSFLWLFPENWLLKHSGHCIYKLLSVWKWLTPGCSVSPCIYQFRFIINLSSYQGAGNWSRGPVPARDRHALALAPSQPRDTWNLQNNMCGGGGARHRGRWIFVSERVAWST